MYGEFKGSFASKYRKQGVSLKCDMCKNVMSSNNTLDDTSEENIESPRHYLEYCPLVSDLKVMYDTESDLGLVQFFRSVLQRRGEIDNS